MRALAIAMAMMIGGAATVANAADITPPMVTKAPPALAPIPTWTGFYIGANLGGGWSRVDYTGVSDGTSAGVPFAEETIGSPTGGTARRNLSGFLGGGQFGFNYEFAPRWVAGLEADIDGANINGSNVNCTFLAGVMRGCSQASSKTDALGTVRARLGYAFDNVLLYGTGGFAWSHGTSASTPFCFGAGCPGVSAATIIGGGVSTSGTATGWTAGGGAEWRFLPNWTVRLEYLHYQFDGVGTTGSGSETIGGTPVLFTFRTTSNTSIDAVRVGVSYLFH